jgi:male germ cell-associated kinase
MNRYKILKSLGDGTYGSVLKAVNKQTGEVVRGGESFSFSLMNFCVVLSQLIHIPKRHNVNRLPLKR